MNRKFHVLVSALTAILLTACPGPYAVKHATATDWVWGVEDRQNGVSIVWFRYDNYGAYCVSDPNMIKTAQSLREQNKLASYEYATINNFDPDAQNISGGGCPDESENHKTFRLISIRPACDTPIAAVNVERCRIELAQYDIGR